MGKSLAENFPESKEVFERIDEALGQNLSKVMWEGSEDTLKQTKNTQPAILTVSYSIYQVLKTEFDFDFDKLKFFAGHSLGEYSALVCANSLSFNEKKRS